MSFKSCAMVRRRDLEDGAIGKDFPELEGEFYWGVEGGQRTLYLVVPSQYASFLSIPVRLLTEHATREPMWVWDGNEDSPTLNPSLWVNQPRPVGGPGGPASESMAEHMKKHEWHGFIKAGQMEGCG